MVNRGATFSLTVPFVIEWSIVFISQVTRDAGKVGHSATHVGDMTKDDLR
jgi:hypothetical protein